MENYSIHTHLPFCSSKCPYCDFHSLPMEHPPFAAYRRALVSEWRTFAPLVGAASPTSVYLGGGTPSIWPSEELVTLLSSIPISPSAEVTVEINPGSADRSWLTTLKKAGVNRVSIGVQALRDDRLRTLGRDHTAADARRAIDAVHDAEIVSIGADIIYGTPGQTPWDLEAELYALVAAGVHHVSAYELTIADHTGLGQQVRRGAFSILDESTLVSLWHTTRRVLRDSDILQYEVSNYARTGYESRHNSHYWSGGQYVGLGSGAHGYIRKGNDHIRYANITDIDAYLHHWKKINEKQRQSDDAIRALEQLSLMDLAKERIMLGFRIRKGIDLKELFRMVPPDVEERWRDITSKVSSRGWAKLRGDALLPTTEGMLRADAIAEEFF